MKQGEPLSVTEENQTKNTESSAGYTLGGAVVASASLRQPEIESRTIIDDFMVLSKIGPGGCGVVYKARQLSVQRDVALKLILPGLAVPAVLKRFEKEKEALGLLNHPNIVDIIFYGKTGPEWGNQPYIAMEYVSDQSITKYCENNKLSVTDRLHLFLQVCAAIEEAHSHGIIHRDIKPSNILVVNKSAGPVVKVIDFGIAKAFNNGLASEYETKIGQQIGTPAYMSPEQTGQDPDLVDEGSDVYLLGVLLNELLVGGVPLNLDGLDRTERDTCIRDVVPQSPSTMFSELTAGERRSIALRRNISQMEFLDLLRTGLDQIVMKCLEKKRMNRFETVRRLADEVQFLLESPSYTKEGSAAIGPLSSSNLESRIQALGKTETELGSVAPSEMTRSGEQTNDHGNIDYHDGVPESAHPSGLKHQPGTAVLKSTKTILEHFWLADSILYSNKEAISGSPWYKTFPNIATKPLLFLMPSRSVYECYEGHYALGFYWFLCLVLSSYVALEIRKWRKIP